MIDGTAFTDRVRADEQVAGEIGISGVPFYVLDRAYGISGAQATEAFATVLAQVWQERHAGPTLASAPTTSGDEGNA